ncbi:MAG TPA: TIGR03067 domain-containing protein [Fimbriiglobus sp.]
MSLLRTLSVLTAAVFVGPAFGQNATKADKAAASLDGTYKAVSGERDGKALTENQLKGLTFRFDGEKMEISDKSGKVIHKCTHTIDTASKPWRITMKMTDTLGNKTVVGLVEKTGDTVRIIYPLAGGETPTEFKTKEKQEMYTLKMQK